MSAFTESALIKKLSELNTSQQSIQTLSLWLIHHRKHHTVIVQTWQRELQNVPETKKLTFMYLANDVIQNSKKKGPEYGKEFSNVLPKVFAHIGDTCKSDKLMGSLGRILNIWQERGVYDAKTIADYRSRLHHEAASGAPTSGSGGAGNSNGNTTGNGSSKAQHSDSKHSKTEKSDKREKRKHEERPSKSKRMRTPHHTTSAAAAAAAEPAAAPEEENGHTPPYLPLGEPPEPEELIKALTNIENSASSDALVRERIAKLPPEISEISCITKLEDKDKAKVLARQVNEAVDLLNDYNARLAAEMEERTKLAAMLRDFQAEQKELLAQAEQRLDEHKKKLAKMLGLQKEIRDHLSNLPDLTQLPDVTGGLAPLPSAGDLFNTLH
ncbi:regulation of nuclear pre-mRNA domain-containing protein 1B [Drosophila sulfurigaster albostrigata]|uniref:regulation of nuclear pre-mRNA domain-containing protein 1B n=1 Tax=Drosophila sulfurigaster albostrigata TaxID=89887 RepID=UPI002D218F91|nr:regulation of nuclear pre-mRNA domain-containing protein 1B [Drosophila sulfurigaster albostrigata]